MLVSFPNKTFKTKSAKSHFKKMMGYMGVKKIPDDEGMLFENCNYIHCFFMEVPIDVIYLDKSRRVVFCERVEPWHLGKHVKEAYYTFETAAGAATGVCVGDIAEFTEEIVPDCPPHGDSVPKKR